MSLEVLDKIIDIHADLVKEDVVNQEVLKSIESTAICNICLGIVLDPIMCENCQMIFCKKCYEDWTSAKGNKECPLRCGGNKTTPAKIISRLLGQLKFKCKNGCATPVTYDSMDIHYFKECPKLDYRAKYLELLGKLKEEERKENEIFTIKNLGSCLNSKHHIHTLVYYEMRNSWNCSLCSKNYSSSLNSYFCYECNFSLCDSCVKENK